MIVEMKEEYPCGYSFKIRLNPGWFETLNPEAFNRTDCPLHGKKCVPQIHKSPEVRK